MKEEFTTIKISKKLAKKIKSKRKTKLETYEEILNRSLDTLPYEDLGRSPGL